MPLSPHCSLFFSLFFHCLLSSPNIYIEVTVISYRLSRLCYIFRNVRVCLCVCDNIFFSDAMSLEEIESGYVGEVIGRKGKG